MFIACRCLVYLCVLLEGAVKPAVRGDEQPLSFHSNTLTQSVSMATNNGIS